MSGKALSIKNDSKINYLAKEISEYIHRGSATTEKLSATLHMIKEKTGLRTLKSLEQSHIGEIVSGLREKAEAGGISLSNANSNISSINNIIKYLGREDLHVIKASDYGLSRNISEKDGINKENSRESAEAFKSWLNQKYYETKDLRYAALKHAVNIQSVNLRLRESLLMKLENKDLSGNILKVSAKGDGSKNSRAREIKLNSEQKQALIEARNFLNSNKLKNLNIGTLKQGRDFANNVLKAFRAETGAQFHYHGERHYQAHSAYKSAWSAKGYDIECRARTGENKQDWQGRIISETGLSRSEFKAIDKEIRQEISRNLGHERIEITNRYLG
jgi:predicted DNA binding CopG/RHH family protein